MGLNVPITEHFIAIQCKSTAVWHTGFTTSALLAPSYQNKNYLNALSKYRINLLTASYRMVSATTQPAAINCSFQTDDVSFQNDTDRIRKLVLNLYHFMYY